ncbi:MAG TPA: hypothetical protein VF038_10045 [Usitatibacter sp.]|jgi:hypothetical protein
MKWRISSLIKVSTAALALALPFVATESQAMPSFARQTGMVCNSCHIGTDNVPNFTRTGRLFAMRGYTRPVVREKLRADGQTAPGEPQYGGDYISLNWTDFFAARFISSFASQSKTNGVKSDVRANPISRMAMFYTGPVTDWLGLWTEIGYLGNNSLQSVTNGESGPSNLNFFAYDEYRLSTSRTISDNSFIGMSYGNEPGDVVTQFVFPTGIPRFFSLGQGGTGKAKTMGTLSFHAFLNDSLWLQFAPNTGVTNNSWSDGWQKYYSIAYDFFRKTDNDVWVGLEYSHGNDNASILTPYKTSFICPGTCPPGVTDSSLSFSGTLGGRPVTGAPIEKVKKFHTYSTRVEWDVADRGPHSWIAMIQANGTKQDYESGASAERNLAGVYLRYFFHRTYGIQASYWKDFKYEYHGADGVTHNFGKAHGSNIVLLWNPAMNVSFHAAFNPNSQSAVFTEASTGAGPSPRTSSSWDIGMEYSF